VTRASSPPPVIVADLRERLAARRAELERRIPAPGHEVPLDACGLALGHANARALDELLRALYPAVDTGKPGMALGGVGSYGRGAVALHSDLDVRLLAQDERRARLAAEALLYPLWDMGVAIGHQVVAIGSLVDAARTDLPTATSLLDFRHVAGDASLVEALRQKAASGIFAQFELPRFMRRLEDEVASRHERFGGSVYLLEPDVKHGPGGLRDLDVARWAALARYGVGELDALVRVGALVAREAAEIAQAAEMLWRIRNLLHAHAGRRSDRFTFDEQEAIAALLGFGAGGEAVERLMSAYYRAAGTISRARDMIVARATPHLGRRKPHIEDVGHGVRIFEGAVTLADTERLPADPALAMRVVAVAVERGLPLLPYARDVLARAAADPAFAAHLRASPEAARRFVELVTTARETKLRGGSVLRELSDLGLLLAVIPEFSPVVGRVHHDVYHVYTVDVHSVAAVDRLAALVRGDLAAEFPLASRLAAEITRPAMLFFATLLHDVGKAIGGRDHSQRGAEMARVILARLGLSPDDVDEACHLIQKHLVMYHVATKRDLDDPGAIRDFSREVHGREGLRDLYLLTVADLSTTSPTSMTSWKSRMLGELYLMTDAALGGSSDGDGRLARARGDVERELSAKHAGDEAERRRALEFLGGYLASMPERYLLANAPAAVAAHAELAREHDARIQSGGAGAAAPVSVGLVPSRHPEAAAEICVVAADRPGLLAAITAALSASRLEVHGAQIHSRVVQNPRRLDPKAGGRSADGPPPVAGGGQVVQAVDLFWVRDRGDGVDGVARAVPKLVRDINAIVSAQLDATEVARRRGASTLRERGAPGVRTQVAIDDRASPSHTVIEVTTRDRPGLLFSIADALYRLGLSIAVAKINTEGLRVADVFYVTEASGAKVAPGARAAQVRDRLVASLDEGARAADPASE
jgi:[protein-PII] uridylyltransferase